MFHINFRRRSHISSHINPSINQSIDLTVIISGFLKKLSSSRRIHALHQLSCARSRARVHNSHKGRGHISPVNHDNLMHIYIYASLTQERIQHWRFLNESRLFLWQNYENKWLTFIMFIGVVSALIEFFVWKYFDI